MSSDLNLDKIGAALQSSNLYAAQHFGLELQIRGVQLQTSPSSQQISMLTRFDTALALSLSNECDATPIR